MDPRAPFRTSFVETARRRVERVSRLWDRPDGVELRSAASELRCLAGEAMMLDFGAVADAARVAEQAAVVGDRTRMRLLLTELEGAIDAIARA